MFNISLDSTSFRLEANKLLGPAFNFLMIFYGSLGPWHMPIKRFFFMFSYMKLLMYITVLKNFQI